MASFDFCGVARSDAGRTTTTSLRNIANEALIAESQFASSELDVVVIIGLEITPLRAAVWKPGSICRE